MDSLKIKLSGVLPELNERQRRILLAAEAEALGYGGVKALSDISGVAVSTIRRGILDLRVKPENLIGARTTGGGRKKSTDSNPDLMKILQGIIEPDTRGDPESPLRWTCRSVRNIADALQQENLTVSHTTVAAILHELEYSLQGNKKTKEGADHPDRNKQFLYINKMAKKFLANEDPAISVDTKKKELVGNYKNPGQEWASKGRAIEVNGHDFPDKSVPKAIPYGVYDLANNNGWVNVGVTADTAEFAVESIRQWWMRMGKKRYPRSKRLLIFADGGGSNGYRSRLWKREIQKISNLKKLEITVCHFPRGTSKWNKIEHRMFSFISLNSRGRALATRQIIVNLIRETPTKTGFKIHAAPDEGHYPTGRKVADKELEELNLRRETFQPNWNYSLAPKTII